MDERLLARVLDIQARIMAVQIGVEGMKADNTARESRGEALAWPGDRFEDARREIEMWADQLRAIQATV